MLKLREDAEVSDVDGSTVMMIPSGDLAVLNETAAALLKAVNGYGSLQEALEAYASRYGIGLKQAKDDLELLKEELRKHELIEE